MPRQINDFDHSWPQVTRRLIGYQLIGPLNIHQTFDPLAWRSPFQSLRLATRRKPFVPIGPTTSRTQTPWSTWWTARTAGVWRNLPRSWPSSLHRRRVHAPNYAGTCACAFACACACMRACFAFGFITASRRLKSSQI